MDSLSRRKLSLLTGALIMTALGDADASTPSATSDFEPYLNPEFRPFIAALRKLPTTPLTNRTWPRGGSWWGA